MVYRREAYWEHYYITKNDQPNICQNCSTECYVDDTKLLLSFSVNDPAQAIESVNSDLQLMLKVFNKILRLNFLYPSEIHLK